MNSRTPHTPPAAHHRDNVGELTSVDIPGQTSELDVEATIKAKGLTAPRVTPQDLDGEIVDAIFHRFPGTTVTVALLMLQNGFSVTGESAAASPENFDEKLGRDIAYRNARDKLWSLLGFRLKDRLHAEARGLNLYNPPGHAIGAKVRKEVGRMGSVLQLAARTAHEVNRAYCATIGDTTHVPWDAAPQWQRDSAVEGVRALLSNPSLTPADLHQGWCQHKLAEGWQYGETKDAEAKTHPCLVPYDQLPAEQRAKDELFRASVLNAAHAAGWSPELGAMAGSLAEGASASPDQLGAEDQTKPVAAGDVGAIAPGAGDLTARQTVALEGQLAAEAGGRSGNAEVFLEERRRRNLGDKPDNPAGRVDSNARVGSLHIDNTPKKDA